MTTIELLGRLRALDITLALDGDRLKVSAPEGAMTAELRAELARRKPELVALVREQAARGGTEPARIGRAAAGDAVLSYAQERFWFLEQLVPGTAAYQVCFGVRLAGRLDRAVLTRALDEIVRRHQILRTVIAVRDGRPRATVLDDPSLPLQLLDLTDAPGDEGAFAAAVSRVLSAPFDLGTAPPVRGTLIALGPTDHALVVVVHHAAFDAWSAGVFVHELGTLYKSFAAGAASPLPEPDIQYADFAAWQRDAREEARLQHQREYWTTQLANLPTLELPTDRPRQALQSFRGGRVRFSIPRALTQALEALGTRERATPFMTLLAAFYALLHRYSGQGDLVVGTAIAGRQRPEVEGLIGPFINSLVLRGDASGDPTFRELLGRVREMALQAYANQDLPFEKIVDELRPERTTDRNPLFQVMLAVQNVPFRGLELPDLQLSAIDLDRRAAVSDLELIFFPTEAGLEGQARYSADLFDQATIERLLGHFHVLLEAVAGGDDRRLSELPLLTASETAELAAWHAAAPVDTRETREPAHTAFERRAAATPQAAALVWRGERVSYAELDERADRLADALVARGAGPGTCVGICLERSPAFVIAALAVLKAGAAYLPLDPLYPADRLAFMLADARVPLVITNDVLAPRVSGSAALVLRLDEPAIPSPSRPARRLHADDLAYVIYTSGSTGTPKGVALTHRGLANLVAWHTDVYGVTSNDAAALVAGLGFDASVWELWPYLTAGACIHIPDEGTRSSPSLLLEWLAAAGVTICFAPTPVAEAMLASELPSRLALRTLLTGGDKLHAVRPGLPFALYNNYGPTENTVVSTWFPVPAAGALAPPPIGAPVSGSRAYVLDRARNPVPVGVPGELHVAGESLARGYLHQPALTADRFVPDPFGRPGDRMYRTGDLVRRRADGCLEFIGRLDEQVKIRGFRIEPAEIEAALESHPDVRAAVVVAQEESPERKRLIAYLVPVEPGAFSPAAVRAHVQATLPDYMVPTAFVALEELPMTANGKIDRRALPSVPQSAAQDFRAPRTPIEELIAVIWADLLGLARVGLDDNFFELGGHSLLATQAASRIRDAMRVELPLRKMFEHPTLEALARQVEDALEGETPALPAIEPAAATDVLPLSFAQQRLWFLDQLEPGSSLYNVLGAVRLRGALDADALERSLAEIARRHGALRTTFSNDAGVARQVVGADIAPTRRVDEAQRSDREREVLAEQLALDEARMPFDLEAGPLYRTTLVRFAADDHLLLVTMHHIVSDGWSLGVFVRELAALYRAFTAGAPSPLAPLPVQYADFARWQRQWLTAERLSGQLAYWRQQLGGSPPVVELPADRPRPPQPSYRGRHCRFSVPHETAAALNGLGRREGATLFMTLHAAFTVLLHRYARQDDIVVGTAVANRQRAELEGLIGFFVNTLVLRTDLSGDPTYRELLTRVREVALSAYSNQDIPFEQVVDAIQPARSGNLNPFFQVMFVLQNAPQEPLVLPGLTLEPVPLEGGTSKFDLLLTMWEREGALEGSVEYSTDLFDAGTIDRLIGSFQTLLGGIAADPALRISELPLLDAAHRRSVLVDSASAVVSVPPVHVLVEAQAQRTPDRIAVRFGDRELTYRELNARANRLAHHLRARGVGPDARVGVSLDRSLDLTVAILATLKAGGAYVPLDPAYPADRRAFMIGDARAAALIVDAARAEELCGANAHVICLEAEWAQIEQSAPDGNLTHAIGDDNLAYVIYTSGSTGIPKGVAMTHGPLSKLMAWQLEHSAAGASPRTLQFASPSFDVSFQELFSTWCAGGTLVLIGEEMRRDPDELLRLVVDERVERVFVPFVALQQVAQAVDGGGTLPVHLREIVTAGEALQVTPQVARLFERLPGCTLENQYGPSESHVVTAFTLTGASSTWPKLPPIGRPVPSSRIYVLDSRGQPVPIGVLGELYIAGPCLARGYLDRPALTAERFVPDPHSPTPGARMYRTGDVARYREDGEIEFFGRVDHQVKIRGFRVELGEIEAVLSRHPAVGECVVTVREDIPGDKRLAAYVVTREAAAAPATADLRSFLAGKLPEYMVPTAFVSLERLPLTPSGKVDRRSLPVPEGNRSDFDGAYVEPRNAVEARIAAVWADTLRIPKIGALDDFFGLGGHSLLATQVVARIRDAFQVELPLKVFFERPTVAALAEQVENRLAASPIGAGAGRADRELGEI
nr:condensation domain-containing protein [uncultured bacterium]